MPRTVDVTAGVGGETGDRERPPAGPSELALRRLRVPVAMSLAAAAAACRVRRAPVSLALLLGPAFVEAAADLRDTSAGELYDRFVGWIPSSSDHYA